SKLSASACPGRRTNSWKMPTSSSRFMLTTPSPLSRCRWCHSFYVCVSTCMARRVHMAEAAALDIEQSEAIVRATVGGVRCWLLRTRNTATLLYLDARDVLCVAHWGAGGPSLQPSDFALPLSLGDATSRFLDGLPLAFAVYGEPAFKEPCLVVAHCEGR